MKSYCLKLFYDDNRDLTVNLDEEKLIPFFKAITKKEIYFDDMHITGFWTDIDKVRYISFNQIPEQQEVVSEKIIEQVCN